jgi:hypothetical protein
VRSILTTWQAAAMRYVPGSLDGNELRRILRLPAIGFTTNVLPA